VTPIVRFRFVGWSIAALLAALHVWMLQRYAVNFPLHDDYTQLLSVPSAFDAQSGWLDKIAYVFALSTDHRIATLRLVALIQAKLLGGLNFRTMVWFGNLLCVAAALLVLSRAEPPQRPWVAALLAAFVFSPANFISQYWATGALAHFSLVAYAFGALFCVVRRGAVWTAAGLVLAAAAAFTVSNGIMVFPVAIAALWLEGRRRTAAFWALLTIALFAFYFIGYQTPGGRQTVVEILQHPLRLAVMFLAALGSMADRFEPSVALGAAIVAAWLALALFRRMRDLPREPIVWMAFLVLSTAAITAGRAALGPEAMLNSRYRIYSQLAVAITLLAVATQARARIAAALPIVALPVALWWFAHTWYHTVPSIADLSIRLRNALDHYAFDGRGIYYEFPPPAFGDSTLAAARAEGRFHPVGEASAPARLDEDDGHVRDTGVPGLWSLPPHVDARSITVGGFAPPLGQDVWLRLEGEQKRYAARLWTDRMFRVIDDVDPTIFWGTSALSGVAPGRYRIGYAFGAGVATRVAWTDARIDVK
jgi:hypothetical protein